MILYFDNYITNEPFAKGIYASLDAVRSGCNAYKMPDKLSIAMYTLASYAELGFTNALIKYTLQDESKYDYFEQYVKSIFPKAIIIRGRSDSAEK